MKGLVRLWCRSVAWILGLHSYLLGDENEEINAPDDDDNEEDGGEEQEDDEGAPIFPDLGAAHQALMPREGKIGVQPYQKPQWFHLRLIG